MVTSPTPRYQQVADALREQILAGEWGPGERVPSGPDLAEEHGVSRGTARDAVRVLVREGLVVTEQGRGTRVREQPRITRLWGSAVHDRATWSTHLQDRGHATEQRIREVATEDPRPEVAGWLELPDDEQVVVRRRLMLVDGRPTELADSHYPASLADGTVLADSAPLPEGSVATLAEMCGGLGRFRERVGARRARADEVRLLDLADGDPVLRFLRVISDGRGRPIELYDATVRSDQVFSYEIDPPSR